MDDLDRLWEATRPPAPTAEAWDRMWASVAERVDEPEPETLAMPWRRRWAVAGLILLAQAAAVILAVGVYHRYTPAPEAPVRIEEGQLVLIRGGADAVQVTDLTPRLGGEGVDAWYLVHNHFESAAGPFVAMVE